MYFTQQWLWFPIRIVLHATAMYVIHALNTYTTHEISINREQIQTVASQEGESSNDTQGQRREITDFMR